MPVFARPTLSGPHPESLIHEVPDWIRCHEEWLPHLDEGPGYVILRGLPVKGKTEKALAAEFQSLVERFGEVSPHGQTGERIWRVYPRGEMAHQPTFSEAASEAPLHTDNSWVPSPEDYFALLVVRPAGDGGHSQLISAGAIREAFARTEPGPRAMAILSGATFPFAGPDVFPGREDVVLAPVWDTRGGLRFRHDVIRAGFERRPDLATPDALWAVETFHAFLLKVAEAAPVIALRAGDVVLASNHRVLHARTHFSDTRRFLLRARMRRRAS